MYVVSFRIPVPKYFRILSAKSVVSLYKFFAVFQVAVTAV